MVSALEVRERPQHHNEKRICCEHMLNIYQTLSSVAIPASIKFGTIQRRLAWTLRKDDNTNTRKHNTFFFAAKKYGAR